ncbi:MAG: DEAD/DEAH box helicase family protein [Nanoarchaeota archaeon]|nr:DEAD/DEAH box helicase family protein [Nanoarchaeota archaeon]
MMIKIKPRLYQEKIFANSIKQNTLIVLPTGLGKTIIALLISAYMLKKYPNSKILFLAPTKPLCEQHKNFFEENLQTDKKMEILTGAIKPEKRKEMWEEADIIFATPQTVSNDIIRGVNLSKFSLVIFDEAHRAVGNYDYVFIAKQYAKTNGRIIGLTASPEKLHEICKNLFIEKIESRTEKDRDVRGYIKRKKIEKIKIELPEQIREIKDIFEKVLRKKLSLLKQNGVIQTKDINKIRKKELLILQGKLSSEVEKDYKTLENISTIASCIKLLHCLELLQTQGIKPLAKFLEKLKKQALRVKAAKQLVNDTDFREAMRLVFELESKNIEHPKFKKVVELVEKHKGEKIIIFTQYRNTIDRILEHLKIDGVKAAKFIGQKEGMSQAKQVETLKKFKEGVYNVLVSSSVAEEGIHVSEANVGIFFEPVPSGLRKIQREGRVGRTNIGKIYVLITKGTIDEKYYWVSFHKERKITKLIDELKGKQRRLEEFG